MREIFEISPTLDNTRQYFIKKSDREKKKTFI